MRLSNEWSMPRRSDRCVTCGATFEPGRTHNSALFEQGDGYARCDFCLTCTVSAGPPPLAVWRGRRPAPGPRRSQALDRETALQIFLRLEHADAAEKQQFRFVLAMLLWRKRVLKFEAATRNGAGREVWRFTQAGGDAGHDVVRPELAEQQLESLSLQIEQLLSGDEPAEATTASHLTLPGPGTPAEPANA